MAVFKLTTGANAALRGGANRAEGLSKLQALSQHDALGLLEGLKANLRGADGVPKHGVLKLRNSSSSGKTMEFARMRGLDRMLSSRDTFTHTAQAIRALMVRSGLSEVQAGELLQKYRSTDGSFKYKNALELINGTLDVVKAQRPQVFQGATAQDALRKAGIEIQGDGAQRALADKFTLDNKAKSKSDAMGAFGEVFEAADNGKPCMFKRFGQAQLLELNPDGELPRARGMDSNFLAAGKLPGVVGPNRYLMRQVEKLPDGTQQVSHHVVTAGRGLKQFCKEFAKTHPNEAVARLYVSGLIMDKAPGTLMSKAQLNAQQLQGVARGFAAVLINTAAHGVVLGDIKRENAFVDGDKLTLIDTDGAFKRSKWASKAAPQVSLSATFRVPGGGGAGLQQDLWSTGFALLEAAHPNAVNELFALGGPAKAVQVQRLSKIMDGDGPARPAAPPKVNASQIMAKLTQIVGQPARGSVDEFAFLCIKQALSQTQSAYTQRFTGQGSHLLDAVLAHPVVGGPEAFIAQHLVKKAALPQPPAAPEVENLEGKPLIVDDEVDNGFLFRPMVAAPKKRSEDDDLLIDKRIQEFIQQQFKTQNRAGESSDEESSDEEN